MAEGKIISTVINKETLYPFVGFYFGGKHSIDFNIYRVSDGSRYTNNLLGQFNDKIEELTGQDGSILLNSFYKNKTFNVSIAYDNLTKENIQSLKTLFNGKTVEELIFDEEPNKIYLAKVSGTPTLNYICFEENNQDIYKGEGQIQFICYDCFSISEGKKQETKLEEVAKIYYQQENEENLLGVLYIETDNITELDYDLTNVKDIQFIVNIEAFQKYDYIKCAVGNYFFTIQNNPNERIIWEGSKGVIYKTTGGRKIVIQSFGNTCGNLQPVNGKLPVPQFYDVIGNKIENIAFNIQYIFRYY